MLRDSVSSETDVTIQIPVPQQRTVLSQHDALQTSKLLSRQPSCPSRLSRVQGEESLVIVISDLPVLQLGSQVGREGREVPDRGSPSV